MQKTTRIYPRPYKIENKVEDIKDSSQKPAKKMKCYADNF